MSIINYVGLDVHKKTIAYCMKRQDGRVLKQGTISANRGALSHWVSQMPAPWIGGMEATLFTGWIYDFLKPHAAELKVGDPKKLEAIWAGKKKNDKLDAERLADLLRCDLFPECYMAPHDIRNLRRALRFRNLMVRMATRMKNKISGLLMEVGAEYDARRLHGKKYFHELLDGLDYIPHSVIEMLGQSRIGLELFQGSQRELLSALRNHSTLRERVRLLMTIAGIGEVTALTWALEVGEPERFGSIKDAVSYCGLCSAQKESAGKSKRGPISKQRNKYLQTILVEAAHLAPNFNPELKALYEREAARSHKNRATLAVARKLVAWLFAVDKRGTPFEPARSNKPEEAA